MDDQPGLPDSQDDAPVVFTARELAMIEEGLASVEAFGTIPANEVFAWVESLGTASPLSMPQPRKRA